MKSYKKIFVDSYLITLKNKWFWILGILAAIVTTHPVINSIRNLQYFIQDQNKISGFIEFRIFLLSLSQVFTNCRVVMAHDPKYFILTSLQLIFFLFIIALLLWLSIVSLGALIYACDQAIQKKKVRIKPSLKKGFVCFWPILGIEIASLIISWYGFHLLAIPLTMTSIHSFAAFVANVVFFVLFSILLILTLCVNLLATFSVVLDQSNFIQAIKQAILLFKKNWLIYLETFLGLTVIKSIATFLGMIFLLFFELPVLLFQIILKWAGVVAFLKIAYILSFVIFLFILTLLAGIVISFEFTFWTHIYRQTKEDKSKSLIHYLLSKLKK